MKNWFLFIAMALLAFFAVGAGLYTVGGPFAARLERQDFDLLQDLNQMATRLKCNEPEIVLPETLQSNEMGTFCNGKYQRWTPVDRKRPDVAVSYHRKSDTTFKLCAAFHDPSRSGLAMRYVTGFDPKTGCLHRVMR